MFFLCLLILLATQTLYASDDGELERDRARNLTMGQAKNSDTVYVSGLGIDADTDAMSKKFKKEMDELQTAKSRRGHSEYKRMLFHTCNLSSDFAPLEDIIDYLRTRGNFQKIILVNCSHVEEFTKKVEELGRKIMTIPS